ncbi:hypothetical protein [Anabaena sp. UHCC 0451]|uniref:hypothetical protein n=1 Tax=Anabaena sp. UHCC 0451 TaxID=2055235 RepID=UPI002B1FFD99|nr:hypothetical protein [Anabaena sp. UHCC 0451]MEA5577357.1 hypothetical protein [Anabaena sp. UHCC 0451]
MLKTNHIKYISVSLLISLMLGCQRPPLESEKNNVKVQASASSVVPQKADDFKLVLSAHSELKTSINKLNGDLKKLVDEDLQESNVNFMETNTKLKKLQEVILELTKNTKLINNDFKIQKLINDINNTITDIAKVIQTLEKGLTSPDAIREVQKLIELKKNTGINPTGIFRKTTQQELEKFLSQRIKNLDQQFTEFDKLIKEKSDNTFIDNTNIQSLALPSSENTDTIIISQAEIDNVYKRLNLTVSVTILIFIIFGGLIAWLLYKLNTLETKESDSSHNITQPEGIVNYIEGEFTQIKRHFDNLDERLKTLEMGSQNPQSPSLSNYTSKNYQPINTPVNRAVHPPKPQTENIYQSQTSLSNQESQIVAVYNNNPRSLSANSITVAESDHTVEQRRIGKKVAPILEENQLGNYWIVREGNYEYLVPKGNIKINEYNYETISNCFECLGYNPSSSSSFTLLKPATVSSIGQHWQLIEPGKLQF